MKEFIAQHKTGIALFILFFVLMPATYFAAKYYFSKIDENQEEIQKISIDEEIVGWQLENIDKYREQEKYVNENEELLNVFVPDSSEAKVALADRFYEEIAQQTDMFVEVTPVNEATKRKAVRPSVEKKPVASDEKKEAAVAVQAEEQKKVEPFGPVNDYYIQLNIVATGTYENFIKFLNKVENMQYLADVTSLTIEKKRNNTGHSLLSRGEDEGESEPVKKEDQITASISTVFYLEDVTKE